jgi:hypothetical protein
VEKISKDIVNIIGCLRPEAWIERVWDTVFLSIANNIVTILGCSKPEARIGKGGARRGGRNQSQASSSPHSN